MPADIMKDDKDIIFLLYISLCFFVRSINRFQKMEYASIATYLRNKADKRAFKNCRDN